MTYIFHQKLDDPVPRHEMIRTSIGQYSARISSLVMGLMRERGHSKHLLIISYQDESEQVFKVYSQAASAN